jgi:hypothetical protein
MSICKFIKLGCTLKSKLLEERGISLGIIIYFQVEVKVDPDLKEAFRCDDSYFRNGYNKSWTLRLIDY